MHKPDYFRDTDLPGINPVPIPLVDEYRRRRQQPVGAGTDWRPSARGLMLKEHDPAPSLLSPRTSAGVEKQRRLALAGFADSPRWPWAPVNVCPMKGSADLRGFLMVSVSMFLLPKRLIVLKAAI